ncbi:YvrJ family protein [Alkalihalophilus sp. As8PL]|uniref:YvrJ family protein n=2 Tax=Alkalihalophilus TaxID=2893060 RepID=A0AB39BUZ2_9BACI|nr:YvrJ family protein [Alkalihalophilus lindianensis]MDV2683221.1 YvrJ family protein [Alkalihalophilus lindianensis]
MEIWIPLISEYGFPVMVTLYLLYRLERKLDHVIEALQLLRETIPSANSVSYSKHHIK